MNNILYADYSNTGKALDWYNIEVEVPDGRVRDCLFVLNSIDFNLSINTSLERRIDNE